MFYGRPTIRLSYQASKMLLFCVEQKTGSKIHLKTSQIVSLIEIAQTSQSKYNSINIVVGGILPRDASWSIDQVLIKEVNEILKPKCSKSFFIYISYDNCWTVADGSLNPDLFLLDNIHLVKKGNLKLAEYSVQLKLQRHHLKHKQFLISYKMAVSFKLNNFDFPIYLFYCI